MCSKGNVLDQVSQLKYLNDSDGLSMFKAEIQLIRVI